MLRNRRPLCPQKSGTYAQLVQKNCYIIKLGIVLYLIGGEATYEFESCSFYEGQPLVEKGNKKTEVVASGKRSVRDRALAYTEEPARGHFRVGIHCPRLAYRATRKTTQKEERRVSRRRKISEYHGAQTSLPEELPPPDPSISERATLLGRVVGKQAFYQSSPTQCMA
jgi:hypothetical protein